MKTAVQLTLLLAAAFSVHALPASVGDAASDAAVQAATASDPYCPRADRDICLAMNLNPRCVNGEFVNDLPASCSRCYCTGCTGKCA